MPMFKYINEAFKFWTSILSPIPRRKMKFSINFTAMLNLVRQIKSYLNRNPSLELLDITHAQYTYTYLLTGRISKLGLHSFKSYTCGRITSCITLVDLCDFQAKLHGEGLLVCLTLLRLTNICKIAMLINILRRIFSMIDERHYNY